LPAVRWRINRADLGKKLARRRELRRTRNSHGTFTAGEGGQMREDPAETRPPANVSRVRLNGSLIAARLATPRTCVNPVTVFG
jgi:hypothetical protein